MKKKFPLVSIIVNCFNGEKFLSQSIKTIFDQTYTNWEIIFWDNKSSDKSREIIKSFKDRRIKYFYSKKYNTLYKSRNLAIKKTKGDYICFLDTDDLWSKKKIKDQLKIMKKKNCDILYSNYLIKNESKKIVRKRVTNSVDKNYSDDTQKLLDDYSLGILTVMVKKEVFKKNFFNSYYQIIGDFDFFIKMSLKFKFFYSSKVHATYRIHHDNFSLKRIDLYIDELKYWIKNNRKKFKNFSFLQIKLNLFKLTIKKNLYKYNLIKYI